MVVNTLRNPNLALALALDPSRTLYNTQVNRKILGDVGMAQA